MIKCLIFKLLNLDSTFQFKLAMLKFLGRVSVFNLFATVLCSVNRNFAKSFANPDSWDTILQFDRIGSTYLGGKNLSVIS
jgi:hypothetical protein